MDLESALEIADHWKYEPPYDFYNATADLDDYEEFIDESQWPDCFFTVWADEGMVGFYSVETDERGAEFAVGMRPDLVGQGSGTEFTRSCLHHAQGQRGLNGPITLIVAAFNERAIRVYERVGFLELRRFMQATNGSTYEFVEMRLP